MIQLPMSRKHTLAMQLQTAHIVAAQHALDVRKSTLEDVKAQRNWLERHVSPVLAVPIFFGLTV